MLNSENRRLRGEVGFGVFSPCGICFVFVRNTGDFAGAAVSFKGNESV